MIKWNRACGLNAAASGRASSVVPKGDETDQLTGTVLQVPSSRGVRILGRLLANGVGYTKCSCMSPYVVDGILLEASLVS